MRKQKWRNRVLERGVLIDKDRNYVFVRFQIQGIIHKEWIGRTTDLDTFDRANFRAQQVRQRRRAEVDGFQLRRQRLLMEDAADLFLKLHGEKRQSAKGIKQFVRYVRLIKEAWRGRYVDTMCGDDMRDYATAGESKEWLRAPSIASRPLSSRCSTSWWSGAEWDKSRATFSSRTEILAGAGVLRK
jgi:hypothetical protein